MIELTEQQQQELRAQKWPPQVRNPSTGETFVLLHDALYERVRAILEAEDEIEAIHEMAPLVNQALDESEAADLAKETA